MSDLGFRLTPQRLLATAIFTLALLLGACGGGSGGGGVGTSSISWSGTEQLGVAGADTRATGVATDANGNVYVAGWTTGNLDGNTLTGLSDLFVTKYDSSGTKQWTEQLGVSSANTQADAVATDTSGNVYVAGYTTGNLDGNTLTGYYDFFVTKYDSSGTKQWTEQLGASGALIYTYAYGVATDASGNIYVAGRTNGNLDGNTLMGNWDFFVTKYNSSGTKQWTEQLGASGADTVANGVATDSSGNVYVGGYTNGNLDGNTLMGTSDFFVTQYDSSGTKQYTKQLGISGGDTEAFGVATDASDNVYVAGYTTGGLDGNVLSGSGSADFFVTKYDSSGAKQWTGQLGVAGAITEAKGVAADGNGNVYVAGTTTGGLDGNVLSGSGGTDSFITKYDSSGAKQWTGHLGASTANTDATGVATDSSGNVYVGGYTNGNLDGNTLMGSSDFFVTQYDSSGTKH